MRSHKSLIRISFGSSRLRLQRFWREEQLVGNIVCNMGNKNVIVDMEYCTVSARACIGGALYGKFGIL